MSAGAYPAEMTSGVEIVIAAAIALVFVLTSVMTLKARHRDVSAWHVHFGAALYGVIFGVIVGFVILPMRMVLMKGELPPQTAALSGFGFLAVMIALRRGLIGRLPFLGPQVKAYRRASLRRAIEASEKQLDRLTPQAAVGE